MALLSKIISETQVTYRLMGLCQKKNEIRGMFHEIIQINYQPNII